MSTASSALKRASSNGTPIASGTDTTAVAAPGAGRKLEVRRLVASNGSSTATWVFWRDGASGTKLYGAYLTQGQTKEFDLSSEPWKLTADTALVMTTSAAGSVEWSAEYTDVLL